MQRAEHCEMVAIASRNIDKAKAAAKNSANSESVRLVRRAAGRPGRRRDLQSAAQSPARAVVDQGPGGGQARAVREADRLDCGRGATAWSMPATRYPRLKMMEAFMYRHHPQWQHARQIVDDGPDRTTAHRFTASSPTSIDDPDNIRNRPSIGGGGLMDIGCYPISLSRFMFRRRAAARGGHCGVRPAVSAPIGSRRPSSISARHGDFHLLARNSRLISACNIYGTRGPRRDRNPVQCAARRAM